jgi:hypothetical protein
MIMQSRILSGAAAALVASAALAHDGTAVMNHDMSLGHKKPPPLAILQLDQAKDATAKYLDVDQAVADGYHDIGLFVPNMGWHYMKEAILDARFEWTRPELLVYADDPCGGKRKLVAIEYAVPFDLAKRAPAGFVGRADEWDANQTFKLWTLHAWVYEFNADGVFAPMNPRVP